MTFTQFLAQKIDFEFNFDSKNEIQKIYWLNYLGEERKEDEIPEVLKETPRAQNSPKRRIPPHESLSEVQAYTLLDGPNAVQEIRS